MKVMDLQGTNHKGCFQYKYGLCYSPESPDKIPSRCIGTKICSEFWSWFLTEYKLVETRYVK